jgi:hypothetical protein
VITWGPMFSVLIGMSRQELLDLSVPEMVDTIDYYQDARPKNG